MGKEILVALVIILIVAGIATLGYAIFSSIAILPRLSNTTSHMGELPGQSQTLFKIGRIYFHNTMVIDSMTNRSMDICDTMKTSEIVILDLVYNSSNSPELCEVFVDGAFRKKIELNEVRCGEECSGEEMKLSLDLKEQDLYQGHDIQVCCDSLCAKKSLSRLCT